MKRPLAEQVIVVSGASSGIGRAVARAAGARGARVVVSARNAEALEHAVQRGRGLRGRRPGRSGRGDERGRRREPLRPRGRALRPDRHLRRLRDGDRLRARWSSSRPEELRRVHGRQLPRPRARLPRRAAAPEGEPRTFIDVNSGLAYRGIPLQAAYCASKAAARTYFESARVELEKHRAGVDLCLILPGGINTPQFDRGRQKLGLQPAAGAADLPAGGRRRGDPPLRRASGARAARDLGGAEAALGPEARAARRRSHAAPERLDRAVHRRAEAGRLTRQPLGDDSGRSRARTAASTTARTGVERWTERASPAREERLRGGSGPFGSGVAIGYHGITKRRASPL